MRITYFLLISLFFLAFSAYAQESGISGVANQAPPPEPYISISPDTFYTLEDMLYIEGRGDPNAIVTVTLQKQGTQPIKFTVKADSFGEWVIAEKTYLVAGNWEVRARQKVGTLVSGESNPRVIRSVVTGFTIFGFQVRYIVVAGIAVFFIAIIVGIFLYFRKKISLLKQGLMEKQLRETETRFHESFTEIRKNLMDELKDLAASSEGRTLTSGELDKRDRILREVEELEQNLEHDIHDIGRRSLN
ncbi:MAG: hypothetical protein AAB407_02230 [Patescibacteria group bacterium]